MSCYGNSQEDRARERELNRYLDSQVDQSEAIDARTNELWARLHDPAAAEKLASDYEIFVDLESEILRAVAYARENKSLASLYQTMTTAIGRKLRAIAEHELSMEDGQ